MQRINYISADEAVKAVKAVKSHDYIHISSAARVTFVLIEALCHRADRGELTDIHFYHSYTEGEGLYASSRYKDVFLIKHSLLGQLFVLE